MKEGCWIMAASGHYEYVDDHARWIQSPGNAERMGLQEDVIREIRLLKWDFDGPGRRAILLSAMADGLIRARGHGPYVTFEFTIKIEAAVQGALPFMHAVAGPFTLCRFMSLTNGDAVDFFWKDHEGYTQGGWRGARDRRRC